MLRFVIIVMCHLLITNCLCMSADLEEVHAQSSLIASQHRSRGEQAAQQVLPSRDTASLLAPLLEEVEKAVPLKEANVAIALLPFNSFLRGFITVLQKQSIAIDQDIYMRHMASNTILDAESQAHRKMLVTTLTNDLREAGILDNNNP